MQATSLGLPKPELTDGGTTTAEKQAFKDAWDEQMEAADDAILAAIGTGGGQVDTAANWTAANPVLNDNQLGYESDTGKFKLGDGVTAWNSLPYFFAPGEGSGDVTGGSASTDGEVAVYNGDTGKAVKRSNTLTGIAKVTAGVLGVCSNLTDVAAIPASQKAAASGVASLDTNFKVVQDPANATATPTAGKIPIADESGLLDGWVTGGGGAPAGTPVNPTATEVGYLSGVTSAIQDQIDGLVLGEVSWPSLSGKPDKYLGDYAGADGEAKLLAALTDIGTSTPTRLCINAAITLTANRDLTAYSNIEFYIHPNCPISYDSSVYTLTIGGTISDCLHKIFNDTAGTPDYTKGVKLIGLTNWVRPNWWGLRVGTGPTDTTTGAINVKAIRGALQAVSNSVIALFTTGYFPFSSKITFPKRVTLKGASSARTGWTTNFDTCLSSTTTIGDDLFYAVDGVGSQLAVHDIFFEAYGDCGHIFNIGSEGGSGIHYFEFVGSHFFGDPTTYSNDTSHYHIWAKNAHQGVINRCRFAGAGSKIYDGMDGWIGGGTEVTGGGATAPNIGIYLNGALLHDVAVFSEGTGIYVNGEAGMTNVRVDQCGTLITGSSGWSVRGTNVRLTEPYVAGLVPNASRIELVNSAFLAFDSRVFDSLNITVGTTAAGQNTLTLSTLDWVDYFLGAGMVINLSGAVNAGNNCNLYIVSVNEGVATVYDPGGTMVAETITDATVTAYRTAIIQDGHSTGSITNTDIFQNITGIENNRAVTFDFHATAFRTIKMENNPGMDLQQAGIGGSFNSFMPEQTYYTDSFTGVLKRKKTDGITAGDIYQDLIVIRSSGSFVTLGCQVGDYVYIGTPYDTDYLYARIRSVAAGALVLDYDVSFLASIGDFADSGTITIEKVILPWMKQHIKTNGSYDIPHLHFTNEGRKRNLMLESGLVLKQWSTPHAACTTVNGTAADITGAFDAFTTSPDTLIGDGFLVGTHAKICAIKLNITSAASGVTYKWQYFGGDGAGAWTDFPTGAVTNATGLNSTGTQIIYFKVPANALRANPYGNGGTTIRHPIFLIRVVATADGGGGGACSAAPLVSHFRINSDSPTLTAGQMAVIGIEDRYGVPVETDRTGGGALVQALEDTTETPSLDGSDVFTVTSASARDITNFLNGIAGKTYTLFFANSNTKLIFDSSTTLYRTDGLTDDIIFTTGSVATLIVSPIDSTITVGYSVR